MITKKTVLILGAGASMDYGFPSGRKLLEEIKEGISDMRKDLFGKLAEYEPIPDKITDFYNNLVYTDPLSIDAFLERRPEFTFLGRLAITMSLIPFEKTDNLFGQKSTHWYQQLFVKLSENAYSPEEFGNNQLAIITFNYDRSIEHYIHTTFKTNYNLLNDEKKCDEIMRKIPIIHVYGSFDLLPWQKEERTGMSYGLGTSSSKKTFMQNKSMIQTSDLPLLKARSQFEKLNKHNRIKEVSEQIKIIPEAEDISKEFEQAHRQLSLAERIYFLGFGYHETNLRRLRMQDFKSKVPSGTCVSVGKTKLDRIISHYGISFPKPELEILKFLEDYVVLD